MILICKHLHAQAGQLMWATVVAVLAIVGAVGSAPAGDDDPPPPVLNHALRDLTFDGAWCWFADPRAIFIEGEHRRTYAGWVNSQGDVAVGYFDHDSGEVRSHILHRRLQCDDHAAPALLVQPDGRLMIFYSKHADRVMRVRTATAPESIFDWEAERELPLNNEAELKPGHPNAICYANPSRLQSGEIVLFWRGTNWKPCISKSEDDGVTWSTGRVMIEAPGAGGGNRPYLKAASDDGRVIHIAFTSGHPRNEPFNSVYYVSFDGTTFRGADGRAIGTLDDLPLDPARCDLVYDARATGDRAWIWDIASNEDGKPVIVYTRLPHENRHVYHYAQWTQNGWADESIVDAGPWFPETSTGKVEPEPHYSGGIVLDHSNPSIVYLSRPVHGMFEIERWARDEHSGLWNQAPVTRQSSVDNVRPFVVRNHAPDGPAVMWMSNVDPYVHYTNYRSAIRMDMPESPEWSPEFLRDDVLHVMEAVGNWQLDNPSRHSTTDWTSGALYAGIMALARVSDDPRFEQSMIEIGERNEWKPGPRPFHADDHAVGQMYLELYLRHREPKMIAPIRNAMDDLIAQPTDESFEWKNGVHNRQWAWCDALFMAPPTLARLYSATGDRVYLDELDRRWWKTTDYLYDPEEHLYFRDSRYFEKREANGEKVFWSRGNGWVIAGLARVLQHLPANHPDRSRYEQLFKEMAERIAEIQQPDGFWHSSLLDPHSYPQPETSGTGFDCFALAWGVNEGLLDRATFAPHIKQAWEALVSCVDSNGRLGWVQPVGQDPKEIRETDTDVYGIGAFLLAGEQVYRMSE